MCAILVLVLPCFAHSQIKKRAASTTPECGYDWPKNEVPWIITGGERAAFYTLRNDEDRTRFIEQFWQRRDSYPPALENAFRQTYYERVLYANEHFDSAAEPGWLTPRGRIYVMYGAPNKIEERSGALQIGNGLSVLGQPNGESKYDGPYKVWQYDKITGIGHPVTIRFVDLSGNGQPAAVVDQTDAAWLNSPPHPEYEEECNGKYYPNNPSAGPTVTVCLVQAPEVHLKDLEEVVSHRIEIQTLSYQTGLDFLPVTSRTVKATVELKFSPSRLKWMPEEHSTASHVQIFGWVVTLTGHVEQEFERDLVFNRTQADADNSVLKVELPMYLYAGPYRLELVARDAIANTFGTFSRTIQVPDLGSWCQH